MAELDTQTIVNDVLQHNVPNLKTTLVEHEDLIDLDEGNLLAACEKIENQHFRINLENAIRDNTRDSVQALFNSLWQLPVEKVDNSYLVTLPEPKTWMPREKPIPKKRPLTKWQEYAKIKGIVNKKKSRKVWDEASQQYKPRWGYKRANDGTQDWLIEIPDNADPYEDHFAKRKTEKKERVAKNELQRLRNVARSQKTKVPGVGLTPTEQPSKDHLSKAMAVAYKSTASLGKFTEKLPKEKPSKFTGKKRKFEPSIGDLKSERERQLQLLDTTARKGPTIDVVKAANRALREGEQQREQRKQKNKTPKKQKGKKFMQQKDGKSKGGGKGKRRT